ncbi:hypothetical protein D3C83_190120 [compost metagenome]
MNANARSRKARRISSFSPPISIWVPAGASSSAIALRAAAMPSVNPPVLTSA